MHLLSITERPSSLTIHPFCNNVLGFGLISCFLIRFLKNALKSFNRIAFCEAYQDPYQPSNNAKLFVTFVKNNTKLLLKTHAEIFTPLFVVKLCSAFGHQFQPAKTCWNTNSAPHTFLFRITRDCSLLHADIVNAFTPTFKLWLSTFDLLLSWRIECLFARTVAYLCLHIFCMFSYFEAFK